MNAEIALLNAGMRTEVTEKPTNVSLRKRIFSAMSVIRDPGVLKPLIIIGIFNILQLSSGTYIIVFYAVDIIKEIGEEESISFSGETLISVRANL